MKPRSVSRLYLQPRAFHHVGAPLHAHVALARRPRRSACRSAASRRTPPGRASAAARCPRPRSPGRCAPAAGPLRGTAAPRPCSDGGIRSSVGCDFSLSPCCAPAASGSAHRTASEMRVISSLCIGKDCGSEVLKSHNSSSKAIGLPASSDTRLEQLREWLAARFAGGRVFAEARLGGRQLPPLFSRDRGRRAPGSRWTRRRSARTAGRSCAWRRCCARRASTRREVDRAGSRARVSAAHRSRRHDLSRRARTRPTRTGCSAMRSMRCSSGSSRAARESCRRTTKRCSGANAICFRSGMSRATSAWRSPAAQQRRRSPRWSRSSSPAALAQPAVYVHRDYMPRNLMVTEPNPGVLDFQDAVYGPISYDMVSLTRDAFVSWEEERVHRLDGALLGEGASAAGLPVDPDFGGFYRDFEWMGLQRHLKVLGIFARIHYRDGKSGYLEDTPRFLRLRARRRRALPRARAARAPARPAREAPAGGRLRSERRAPHVKAMILAAGRGERMRPLTDRVPKPLLEAGGRPLIAHLIERLARAGFTDLVVNVSHLAGMIERDAGRRLALRRAHRLFARGSRRSRPAAASPTRCRCSGTRRSWWSTATSTAISISRAWRPRRRRSRTGAAGAHLVLVDNPPHHPGGRFLAWPGAGWRRTGRARLTFSGIGVYAPALFAGVARGAQCQLAALLKPAMAQGARERRASPRAVDGRRHAAAPRRARSALLAGRPLGRLTAAGGGLAIISTMTDEHRYRHLSAAARAARGRDAGGRRDRADRARAHAQPRLALSLPFRQLFLLPHRVPRARGGAGDRRGRRSRRASCSAATRIPSARSGTAFATARRRRARPSVSTRRTRSARLDALMPGSHRRPRRALLPSRRRRGVGRARDGLDQPGARPGAQRRRRAGRDQGRACAARRDAAHQGAGGACRDAARRGDHRRRAPPRDARGAAGPRRVRDRGRAAARIPAPRRAGAGLYPDRRRGRARLRAALRAERRRAEGRRAAADRRRLRARRLRRGCHAHLSGQRPVQRAAARDLRAGAGGAGRGHRGGEARATAGMRRTTRRSRRWRRA